MKQGKAWGTTEEIFNNGIVSVHHLSIKKGGYSSKHWHQFKANIFHVISGELKIEIWQTRKKLDVTVLDVGEKCYIPPHLVHRFIALSDVECYEIYEVKLRGEDIERETVGGSDRE